MRVLPGKLGHRGYELTIHTRIPAAGISMDLRYPFERWLELTCVGDNSSGSTIREGTLGVVFQFSDGSQRTVAGHADQLILHQPPERPIR